MQTCSISVNGPQVISVLPFKISMQKFVYWVSRPQFYYKYVTYSAVDKSVIDYITSFTSVHEVTI